jgi:hypothetical protein
MSNINTLPKSSSKKNTTLVGNIEKLKRLMLSERATKIAISANLFAEKRRFHSIFFAVGFSVKSVPAPVFSVVAFSFIRKRPFFGAFANSL